MTFIVKTLTKNMRRDFRRCAVALPSSAICYYFICSAPLAAHSFGFARPRGVDTLTPASGSAGTATLAPPGGLRRCGAAVAAASGGSRAAEAVSADESGDSAGSAGGSGAAAAEEEEVVVRDATGLPNCPDARGSRCAGLPTGLGARVASAGAAAS